MALVRGTQANKGSQVPTGGAPSRGNSGKDKKLRGTSPAAQSVVPSTRPASSDKRGGPAKSIKGGGVSSGGGSFGQK